MCLLMLSPRLEEWSQEMHFQIVIPLESTSLVIKESNIAKTDIHELNI